MIYQNLKKGSVYTNALRFHMVRRHRHVAVLVKSINPLVESLERQGWKYSFDRRGRQAVFTHDLDFNVFEFMEHTPA